MARQSEKQKYFSWMIKLVSHGHREKKTQYSKLLAYLHETPFRYKIQLDKNRESDGLDLRYRYSYEHNFKDIPEELEGSCSVLEMMVALAQRCEVDIAGSTVYGDRTGDWFWGMIFNLGLKYMTDEGFNESFVLEKLDVFMDREYEPNGRGGLFTVENTPYDLRTVDIWYQMQWYLNEVFGGDMHDTSRYI